MIEFETKVIDIIQRTPNVKSFRFKVDGPVSFKAGHFFLVSIKIDDQERTKHFSFSNSPEEKDYIEFTKRITDSEFSKALDVLRPGDWAKLKMPYGSFTFEGEYEKVAFLSGGVGITPIRSICKHILDKDLKTDVVLLYGNNRQGDIIFKDDFDNISSKYDSIKVVYTLTASDIDKDNWSGRVGYIDSDMIKQEIPDFNTRIFYICGPPLMVQALVSILKDDLCLDDSKVKIESFAGY